MRSKTNPVSRTLGEQVRSKTNSSSLTGVALAGLNTGFVVALVPSPRAGGLVRDEPTKTESHSQVQGAWLGS